MSTRSITGGVALTFVLLLGACATTKLQEQWRDPDYRAAAGQKVMVVAVTGRDDRRRVFEDTFVSKLREEGVDAVPSYPLLSVIGPENLDAARAAVKKSNATMVLSVRLARVDQQTGVTGGYSSGFYGFYPSASLGVTSSPEPSYSISQTKTYMTETRVFDMKSDKVVWAAALQSEEPKEFRSAAEQYTDLVVDQMRDNKILGGK